MMKINREQLCQLAREAAKNAHVPYSHFHVGAAILAENGKVYTGCNVENASFGLTICAERNACTTMAADGQRSIQAVAIYGGGRAGDAAPCGACRQFLLEFVRDLGATPVYLTGQSGEIVATTMEELCPYPFQSFVPDA